MLQHGFALYSSRVKRLETIPSPSYQTRGNLDPSLSFSAESRRRNMGGGGSLDSTAFAPSAQEV
jgi:hypothetical protein